MVRVRGILSEVDIAPPAHTHILREYGIRRLSNPELPLGLREFLPVCEMPELG